MLQIIRVINIQYFNMLITWMVGRFLWQSRYAHFRRLYESFDRLIRQRKWNLEWEAISRTQEHELSARPGTRRKEDGWGKRPTNILKLLSNIYCFNPDKLGRRQSIGGQFILGQIKWLVKKFYFENSENLLQIYLKIPTLSYKW